VALLLVAWVLPSQSSKANKPSTWLLDFRPVFANRRVLGFTLAYSAHNAELFGFRNWVVAFLVFSQGLQHQGRLGVTWSAATIAALVNLLAMPASVIGNEFAQRLGRELTLLLVMTASAVVAVVLGFSAAAPFWIVLTLVVIYGVTVVADSATITAGVVEAADPSYRGATMAAHSLIGFIGSFLGPIIFGIVLDVAGGTAVTHAWGWAFMAMALLVLMGPLSVLTLSRERN